MRKQHENKWLEFLCPRLKILGRVILSCQFKSGPGHHFKTKSNTYLISWSLGYLDKERHVSTSTDAFMMWAQ